MPTMKDVARHAGVSLGTVSNVLNHKASVSQDNCQRVLLAVEELGYRTNMTARTLKTKASTDIGLIIPDIKNPFYPELARGVEDAANRAGLTVFLCNNDRSGEKEHAYVESLITKNILGLILVKPQIPLREIDSIRQEVEVILVDVGVPLEAGYNVLNVDDRGGIEQGMELLYSYGHRSIAFVSGLMESLSSRIRHDSYLQFLSTHGIPVNQQYIVPGNYSWQSGYNAARTLSTLAEPPTAIFASNDLMAIGCLKALQELGLRVPQDISVLGYDNIDMTNLCSPLLTTINQPKYEMGTRSVEMLLHRLELRGSDAVGETAQMPTHIVHRDSVGAVCNRK